MKDPTLEEMCAFLKEHYKPSRLNRYDGQVVNMAKGRIDDIKKHGKTLISHHDAMCNQTMVIYRDLSYKSESIEYPAKKKTLSHLF